MWGLDPEELEECPDWMWEPETNKEWAMWFAFWTFGFVLVFLVEATRGFEQSVWLLNDEE